MRFRAHLLTGLFMAAAAVPAQAAPVRATVNAVVRASVLKPLTLTRLQDLDFGTLVLGPGIWGSETISVSAAGVRSCSANVACSGAATGARYQLAGTNNATVLISAPAVVLTNTTDTSKQLTMTVQAPPSVVLPNSGNPGLQLGVGGRITVSSATTPGLYVGTLEVTVDYQ